jgi:hypothetical protein
MSDDRAANAVRFLQRVLAPSSEVLETDEVLESFPTGQAQRRVCCPRVLFRTN